LSLPSPDVSPLQLGPTIRGALREVVKPFRDFAQAPRVLQLGINLPYFLEGLVYFGILTLLTKYLSENVHIGDVKSGWFVAALTGGITLSMFLLGEVSDRWGLRRALIFSLGFMICGRVLLASGETLHLRPGLFGPLFNLDVFSLLFIIIGYGAFQPAIYAGVKRFTTEKTAAMGFAVIYAVMNLGCFASGLISPPVRRLGERAFPPNGITGVFWLYVGITVFTLVMILLFVPRERLRAVKDATAEGAKADRPKVLSMRWLREHPLFDPKFSYFIFVLIPVQTLFAHNWLTLPLYIERAYRATPWVSGNFEFFSNINALLIFVLTPLVAALSARADVYKMMIIGTGVMAAPTFLLALGPKPAFLLTYILIMSVGEALWQPRFYQYVAEIAPEGKTGMYMGVAQFPWFLTKLLTGLYSGWFLKRFCPAVGPQDTHAMWMIYAAIASMSCIGLLLAKGWIGKDISARGHKN
jgi:MFS family permease